jgi:glycerol-3-phosphate dehydrogenase
MYDCIIVGAGVNGTFIAHDLSKYNLKVLVIEAENDVGDVTSCANSAIVHSGYDPHFGTLKAKLNVRGNQMYDQICQDLDVEFERIGSLTLAFTDEEAQAIGHLVANAKQNGVEVSVLDPEEILRFEPLVAKNVKKAILAPSAGIINPFELCVALMENAMDNGVELHLNEKVTGINKTSGSFSVVTDKSTYQTKTVVNAAGLYADEINNFVSERKTQIIPRKGEYFVLDHFSEPFISHVLFTIPTDKGKGVLITPTTSHNYMFGPSSDFIADKNDLSTNKEVLDRVLTTAVKMVENIPMSRVIREFAGLRAYHESDDFVINEKDGFINVLGMQSPGLASAPATAELVLELISRTLTMDPKPNYNPKRRPLYRLNQRTPEERNAIIAKDSRFGNMVCRCEKVSEGEVVDAIHRNCGATSVKGVKKRLRPGSGKCQGGFCEPLIMGILARELKKEIKDLRYDSSGAYILLEKTKGSDRHA